MSNQPKVHENLKAQIKLLHWTIAMIKKNKSLGEMELGLLNAHLETYQDALTDLELQLGLITTTPKGKKP